MTFGRPPKHSILLVDDEPEILFSLKSLLRREFAVQTAESGEQALQVLAQQPIDIVMSDQRMPNMSGAELMEQVRLAYPDLIRIIFTGYADSKAVVDSINRGDVYRYITKPWDPDDLIEILRAAGRQHDLTVERRQIHLDLRNHLDRIQALSERMQAGEPAIAEHLAAELCDCLSESARLAQRLDHIIHEENTAVGDHSLPNE